MSNKTMKACPYCNGDAGILTHEMRGIKAYAPICFTSECLGQVTDHYYETEEEAVNDWDTRPIEDTLRRELAEEREKNGKLIILLKKLLEVLTKVDEVGRAISLRNDLEADLEALTNKEQ